MKNKVLLVTALLCALFTSTNAFAWVYASGTISEVVTFNGDSVVIVKVDRLSCGIPAEDTLLVSIATAAYFSQKWVGIACWDDLTSSHGEAYHRLHKLTAVK